MSKTLNVTTPRPVAMPPARPTLNGGAGVGMLGQMGEPAIPVMPGYVLETSEDGRVLSKKKLNELAREVCGHGEDDQLTPEAEEVKPFDPIRSSIPYLLTSPSLFVLTH